MVGVLTASYEVLSDLIVSERVLALTKWLSNLIGPERVLALSISYVYIDSKGWRGMVSGCNATLPGGPTYDEEKNEPAQKTRCKKENLILGKGNHPILVQVRAPTVMCLSRHDVGDHIYRNDVIIIRLS